MSDQHKIGDIIESRQDGSYLYMSNRGILNLDNARELLEAKADDASFLKGESQFAGDKNV